MELEYKCCQSPCINGENNIPHKPSLVNGLTPYPANETPSNVSISLTVKISTKKKDGKIRLCKKRLLSMGICEPKPFKFNSFVF